MLNCTPSVNPTRRERQEVRLPAVRAIPPAPYGKRLTKFERQCVFIGTTENSEWNTDERGARRFWWVLCEGVIDTDGLARDRDQLWAEALARFKSGAKWHLYKAEVLKAAEEAQSSRYAVDVWQDKAIDNAEKISLISGNYKSASISEILIALGVDTNRQDQIAANRIGRRVLCDLQNGNENRFVRALNGTGGGLPLQGIQYRATRRSSNQSLPEINQPLSFYPFSFCVPDRVA